MGNCMETFAERKEEEKIEEEEEEEERKPGGLVKEDGFGNGGFRVKIVLTKEELEWLMFQLKDQGGKRLEDVLGEIEKGRGKVEDIKGWKPSLESIMESPEVLEMDR